MTRKVSRLSTPPYPPIPQSIFKDRWLAIVLSLIFFICVKILISYVVLSGYSRVIVDIEIDHVDVMDAYYSTGNGFQKKLFATSNSVSADKRQNVSIWLKNNIARTIRLDPGRKDGTVKLYGLKFTSYFGHPFSFTADEIYERFIPNENIQTFILENDHVLITSRGGDPQLTYKYNDLQTTNRFISDLLPVVFTVAFYILISQSSLKHLAAFTDLGAKTSSIGNNIGSLDGIRGLAALTVLAEHTGVMKGIGSLGVWLFFSLSGFLLATPFVTKPERAVSYNYMSNFIARRLKRILPMYYLFLMVTMVFKGKNPEMIRHFFFLQGDGHLWTIPQEMFFYLILPFIVTALYMLFKDRMILKIVTLAVLIYLANHYLTIHTLSFYGYNTVLKSMAGIFLGGVMFCYIYHQLRHSRFFTGRYEIISRNICSWLGLTLFLVMVVFSIRMIPALKTFNPLYESEIFGFMAGLFILLVTLADNTLISKIMGFLPLRAVGIVSFSFYLLHPNLISVGRLLVEYYTNHRIGGVILFIFAGVLTYICSLFTYSYIEKPFLQQSKVQIDKA